MQVISVQTTALHTGGVASSILAAPTTQSRRNPPVFRGCFPFGEIRITLFYALSRTFTAIIRTIFAQSRGIHHAKRKAHMLAFPIESAVAGAGFGRPLA